MLKWMQEWVVCKMNKLTFSLIVLMLFGILFAGFVSAETCYELTPCLEANNACKFCPSGQTPLHRTMTVSGIVDCYETSGNAALINGVPVVLTLTPGNCSWIGEYTASDSTKYSYRVSAIDSSEERGMPYNWVYEVIALVPYDRWVFVGGAGFNDIPSAQQYCISGSIGSDSTISACTWGEGGKFGGKNGVAIESPGGGTATNPRCPGGNSIVTYSNLLSYAGKTVKVSGSGLCYNEVSESSTCVGAGLVAVDAVYDDCNKCCKCGNGKLEEGEGCDDGNNVNGDGCNSECKEELGTCAYACKKYKSLQINWEISMRKIKESDIKSKCTNGYNFISQTGEKDVWGEKNFILEKLPKGIPKNLVWNPERDGIGDSGTADVAKNGENYCYDTREEHKDWGTGNHDCVCYAAPECVDEDKDGYGKKGTYNFMCSEKGEDCWDEPTVNWGFEGVWVIPGDFNSNQRKTVAKIYREIMDKDDNGDIADEVNLGIDESPELYGASFYLIIPQDQWTWWEPPKIWVSACTDGIDNDCDGFYDCFDSGCATEEQCLGTCGDECVKEHPATIGAYCIDVKPEMDNRLQGVSFKSMPIKDYSDCSKEKTCICVLSDCWAACENKKNEIQTTEREKLLLYGTREASYIERGDKQCYLEGGTKKKIKDDYERFFDLNDAGKGCCCGVCYQKEDHSTDARTAKDNIVSVLKFVGKDLKEETKADIVKRAEEGTLFRDEQPVHYDRVIGEAKLRFNNFICDEVTNYLVGQEPKYYGIYSSAVIEILREYGKVGKIKYPLSSAKDAEELPSDTLLDKNFRTSYNELIERRSILRQIVDKEVSKVPSDNCKLCPDVKNLGQVQNYKDSSISYFLFSDLFNGGFSKNSSGIAYSIEPHGFVFLKDYTIDYNNLAVIFKFSLEEFSNCSIENLSEPTNFVIKSSSDNVFSYENLTLSFFEGSVGSDTTLNIIKISFDCPAFYELEELPGNPTLLDVLKGITQTFREERSWGYLNDLIRLWKGYF